jgi:ABC-2 type transport system permease protein
VSPTRTVLLVADREVRQRLRSKLFVGSTLVISVVLAVLAFLPALLGGSDGEATDPAAPIVAPVVAVVGELTPAEQTAVASVLGDVDLLRVADPLAASAAVADEDALVAIVPGERVIARASTGFVDTEAVLATSLSEALGTAAALDQLGVGAVAPEVLASERLEVERVGDGAEDEAFGRYLVANVGVVFLFGILIFYSSMIVNGVIEEKGSRVVELLVEAIPVPHLMTGKLLGLGAIGLGQTLVLFAPSTIVLVTTGTELVPPGVGGLSGLLVFWFVLGYALYAVISAGLGSLVSRPEEAQAVLTPANLLMIGGYFISFVALQAPDALVARVASYVPFSAPFVMLVRQTIGEPAPWEIALSVALLLVAIVAFTLLAARIYRGGILRVGARVRLRDAWRSASA